MTFLWHGLTDQGVQVPVQVDDQGRVVASAVVESGLSARCSTSAEGLIRDSFNIGSVAVSGSLNNFYTYTFANPLSDNNYSVVVTGNFNTYPDSLVFFIVRDMLTTGFTVVGLGLQGGAWIGAPAEHGLLVAGG